MPDAIAARAFCADTTSWPAVTFAFASRKPIPGSQGDAFTSCSRNSIASALCPVFSSRVAAGSRFSKGLPTTTTRRRSNSTAPGVSPAAIRISARPRKFAASSCALRFRAQKQIPVLHALIVCLRSQTAARRGPQDFRGRCGLRIGAIALNPGIQRSQLRCNLEFQRNDGRRFRERSLWRARRSRRPPSHTVSSRPGTLSISPATIAGSVARLLSAALPPSRRRPALLAGCADRWARAAPAESMKHPPHRPRQWSDRPRPQPSRAANWWRPAGPQSQYRRYAAERWSGSCRCGGGRRAEERRRPASDR